MAQQVNYMVQVRQQPTTGFVSSNAQFVDYVQTTWTFDQFGEVVNLSGGGHLHTFRWEPVSGVDKVEITSATVRLGAAAVETAEPFTFQHQSNHINIQVGLGKAIRTLKLTGLTGGDAAVALHNSTDVNNNDLKLLVAIADPNGAYSPVHSMPAVPASGVFPSSFTGASFQNDTISFSTPIHAATIRLQLVDRGFPEETAKQPIALDAVSGTYLSLPIDLAIQLDNGSSLFEFPGELPLQSPDVNIPLVPALMDVFQQKLDAAEPLESTLSIIAAASSGGSNSVAQVAIGDATGFLSRTVSGTHRRVLTGEALPLELPLQAPLATESPHSATGDVSITYDGIKLVNELSSELPSQNGNITGHIVAAHKKLKILPPDALIEKRLARVGIIGRSPEPCELVMELLDMTGGIQGAVILDPVTVQLEADAKINVHWFEVADQSPFNLPVGIALRTNIGRFFWVDESDPLIKLAIYDDDPGTETVRLGGHTIATGDQLPFSQQSHSLPAELFGPSLPIAASDLFVTLDIADLTLRYAR